MKPKFLVPNGFTAFSLLLGLASVKLSASGNFELAAWMILWGVLLDKLDGAAARLLKASSSFGVQFDSFADFVAFGIAPAALIYYRVSAMGGAHGTRGVLLVAAVGLYVLATAARLSRFNVTEPPDGDRLFYGIPTTVLGALLGSGYLAWSKYELPDAIVMATPVFLIVGAGLMVSNLRLPKLKARRNKALNVLQFGNAAAAYVLGPLMIFPEYLFGLCTVYTVVGVLWCLAYPQTAPADGASERAAPAQ